MIAEVHIPSFPLNQFVAKFFYYKLASPLHSIDRFLPDGDVHLIFELSGNPQYIYDNDSLEKLQSCKNIWFSGIRTRSICIPSGKDSEMFIVYFHKGRSYPFVDIPLDELTDIVVQGEDLLPGSFLALREVLLNTESIQGKFAAAEQYFLNHFVQKFIPNPCIQYAVNQIHLSPQNLTMKALSDKIGYSQKHFIQMFSSQVGLTPKGFLKLMRFQKTIHEIDQVHPSEWSRVA